MAASVELLARRVERLEAQVRWWRVVGSATLVILGFVAWLVGDLSRAIEVGGETVHTRRVVLVDRAGVERAWFGLGDDDTPRLELYDARGEDLAVIGVSPDGRARIGGFESEPPDHATR